MHWQADATMFDIEHKRWQDNHHNRMCKLRAGMEERLPDKELKVLVENFLGHYCMMLDHKSMFLKYDVFHFVSGMWRTPAERGLLWMGGCRPSEIIKVKLYIRNNITMISQKSISLLFFLYN